MSGETIPSARIQRMISERARSTPAGDARYPVRSLHLNEAPFAPAAGVVAAMQAAAAGLNRYPDHDGKQLSGALAARNGVAADRIVIGAGSNELLVMSGEIALEAGDEVVAPVPGFPAYSKVAALAAASHVGVPNRADGIVDVEAILAAVTPRTRLVFVTSPHNPTGGLMSEAEIIRLVEAMPDHVLLHFDEAYFEFGQHAGGALALPILERRQGPWFASRSFSKAFGLAGARIGYGIASSPALADVYRRIRTNFSVNAVALAGALAALDEPEHLARLLEHNARERERLGRLLAPLGFKALPSAANFLTLLAPRPATELAAALAARNIHVLAVPLPGGNGALRISIGTAADTDAVVECLQAALVAA